jgi:hypothetical protein
MMLSGPTRSWWRMGLCLVVLAGCFAASPARGKGLPAILTHKNKSQMEVWLHGRRGKDGLEWVTMNRRGETATLDLAATDVVFLMFKPDYDPVEIKQLYGDRKFAEAAEKMRGYLVRTFRYLDLPNNVLPDVLLLLRCYYRAENYPETQKLGRMISGVVPPGPMRDEARLYGVLALQGMDDMDHAARLLENQPPLGRKNDAAPLYWYAKARDALWRRDWAVAREYAEQIVSYAPRDFIWLPAGLYFSGKFHLVNGNSEVGRKVLEELFVVAPDDVWAGRAAAVLQDAAGWFTTSDLSGAGRDGTLAGYPLRGQPSFSAGAGKALGLDGEDDVVVLPVDLTSGRFGVSFWFRTQDKMAGLLSAQGEDGREWMGCYLHISNIRLALPGGLMVRCRGQNVADGKWHHLAVGYQDGREVLVFLDGEPVLQEPVAATGPAVTALHVGECQAATQPFLEGTLDEIQVYDRTLAATDAVALFGRGMGGKPAPGLYARLPLEDGPLEERLLTFEDPIEVPAVPKKEAPEEQTDDAKKKDGARKKKNASEEQSDDAKKRKKDVRKQKNDEKNQKNGSKKNRGDTK